MRLWCCLKVRRFKIIGERCFEEALLRGACSPELLTTTGEQVTLVYVLRVDNTIKLKANLFRANLYRDNLSHVAPNVSSELPTR